MADFRVCEKSYAQTALNTVGSVLEYRCKFTRRYGNRCPNEWVCCNKFGSPLEAKEVLLRFR